MFPFGDSKTTQLPFLDYGHTYTIAESGKSKIVVTIGRSAYFSRQSLQLKTKPDKDHKKEL